LIRLEPFWPGFGASDTPFLEQAVPKARPNMTKTAVRGLLRRWLAARDAPPRDLSIFHTSVFFADLVSSSGASTASTGAELLEFVPPE
jgi:hypothetical protein